MWGCFNKFNITKLSHKDMKIESSEDIQQVVLDGISDNMDELV